MKSRHLRPANAIASTFIPASSTAAKRTIEHLSGASDIPPAALCWACKTPSHDKMKEVRMASGEFVVHVECLMSVDPGFLEDTIDQDPDEHPEFDAL